MRSLDDPTFTPWILAKNRLVSGEEGAVMQIPYKQVKLRVIAANGDGWDHISVSLADRTPTWEEMDFIKRTLFHKHEVAVQYHVAVDDHINIHPYVLHLWRKQGFSMPLPPKWMV